MKTNCKAGNLDFFGNKIASEAAGADFCRESRAIDLGFYLYQIGFPCSSGTVFGMAYLVPGHRMFSANITCPRHNILPYKPVGKNVCYPIYIESKEKCKGVCCTNLQFTQPLDNPPKIPYFINVPVSAIDACPAEQCVRHFFCLPPLNRGGLLGAA